MTKAALVSELAAKSGATKDVVVNILDSMAHIAQVELSGKAGKFMVPGIAMFKRKLRPARAAHEGINPKTKEKLMIPAAPATNKVRASPVKTLREAVAKK
jgi:nucleoid DNA-binding protein